jgi:hypothetical protein
VSAGKLVPVLAVSIAFLTASVAHSDSVISSDTTASAVSAHAGAMVWSRQDGEDRYRLVTRMNGVVRDASARPSRHPIEADLGPGRRGEVVAVYSLCTDSLGRRCDVYRYDLEAARERRVGGAATKRCSERVPTIWARAILFERTDAGRHNCRPGLYVKRAGRPARRFRRLRQAESPVADSDSIGKCIAYRQPLPDPDRIGSRIYVQGVGEKRRQRVSSDFVPVNGGGSVLSSPVLYGDFLYWLSDEQDSSPMQQPGRTSIVRAVLNHNSCRASIPRYSPVASFRGDDLAVDGGEISYSSGGVFRVDPFPRFPAP